MTIRILNSAAVALSTAVLLSACGGGGSSAGGRDADPSAQSQGLVYAYPGDGQTEVSTAAPVILRFSEFVSTGDAILGIRLFEGDANGREMDVDYQEVLGEPSNVVIVPADDDPFKPNQQYTVVIQDLNLTNGDKAQDRTLHFTTRALHKGPKEMVVTDMDEFNIVRTFPSFDNLSVAEGQQRFDAMDFSSFRLQMSQPVDADTAVYGQSVKLTYGIDDDQVPATLLVDGRYLTVDPEPAHLDPTQTYTLTLTGDLASTYGANFSEKRLRFKPKDTSPRGEPTELVQRLTVGGRSKLTGRDVNQVPVNGTLLGEDANITQARADSVIAELGDATRFPETLPIRLPKGTVLKGDEISRIMIGGKVPAGFGSGDVTMTLLSDATGYMVENPYSAGGESGNRMIQLMMDVGIATAEARANGAFTQDLLHIELMGIADVDTDAGVLNVDAVSVVEPDILGQEFGYGLLSFQLQSYEDQNGAPRSAVDTTAPTLQSWMPRNRDRQNKAIYQNPGDPIVLNFDKPLSQSGSDDLVTVYKNGQEVASTVHIDGASIVVVPDEPISYSLESSPDTYSVEISDAVTDLAGNRFAGFQYDFEMPTAVEVVQAGINANGQQLDMIVRAPIVSAIYPGFPCVTDESTRDLSNGISGICIGTLREAVTEGQESARLPKSDPLPVMEMPADRPIIVNFSKDMDVDSIVYGQSFVVQKIDQQGDVIEDVKGELQKSKRRLVFSPENSWEEGALYKSTLRSNGDMSSTTCNPGAQICSADGLPLQTQILGTLQQVVSDGASDAPIAYSTIIPDPAGGGRDMENFFVGAQPNKAVLQNLNNLPGSDVNANFFHDANRTVEEPANPAAPYIVERQYAVEEYGATDEPDPNADLTPSPTNGVPIDLNGVLTPKNAVKVLSRNTAGLSFTDSTTEELQALNSVNVGCGFEGHMPFDPQNPSSFYAIPVNCPKQKFVYISGNLNVDVTDEYDASRDAIKVNIWPGQLTATSLIAYTRLRDTPLYVPSNSGPQIMRMRFQEDEQGVRNQPIEAWIEQGPNGPYLKADVELFVDIPELQYNLFALQGEHNMHGYPISLTLEGDVDFLDDGRMVVEQISMNAVDLDIRVFSSGIQKGYMDLLIPQYGTRINYVSQPIK